MIKRFLKERFESLLDMYKDSQEELTSEDPYVREDAEFSVDFYKEKLGVLIFIIKDLCPEIFEENMTEFVVPEVSTEEIEDVLLEEIEINIQLSEMEEDYEFNEDEMTPTEEKEACIEILKHYNQAFVSEDYLEERLKARLYEQVKDLPEIDELEVEIVKILTPTGTKEISFTEEDNARLRPIYKKYDAENHGVFSDDPFFEVYTYLERGCVVVDGAIDCDMAYFSKEFKQELLNILKELK